MARITSDIQFTGSLGNLTAYKMRGVESVVLRTKGGASKARIKTSPSFEQVRRNNKEFSGRATASKWIMKMLQPQKALADYNIAGPLNALLKPIQSLDNTSEWGQRHVQLSRKPQLLAGFSLNRKTNFDSTLRTSLSFSVSRENRFAHIEVPSLLPRINFFPSVYHPYFSIVAVLGIVPDLFYTNERYEPSSPLYSECSSATMATPWYSVRDSSEITPLEVGLAFIPPDEAYSVMLSIGIRYGAIVSNNVIEQVKYAGSAKVLALV